MKMIYFMFFILTFILFGISLVSADVSSYVANSTDLNGIIGSKENLEGTPLGSDEWTWSECDSWSNFNPTVLNQLSLDDAVFSGWDSQAFGQEGKACQLIVFNISEDPADITDISVFAQQKASNFMGTAMWLKLQIGNITSISWTLLDSQDPATSGTEYTHFGSVSTATDYVNTTCGGSGGCVYVLLNSHIDFANPDTMTHSVDFVELNITYSAAAPDTTAPYGWHVTPANFSTSSDLEVNFTMNFTDDTGLDSAILYIWDSAGDLVTSVFKKLNGAANDIWSYVYTFTSEGWYNWTAVVNDTSNNLNWTEEYTSSANINWSLNISIADPSVVMDTPINTTYYSEVTEITHTISNADYCWYYIDEADQGEFACVTTISGLSSNMGSNNWTICGNNTVNEMDCDSAIFAYLQEGEKGTPFFNATFYNTTDSTYMRGWEIDSEGNLVTQTKNGTKVYCWVNNDLDFTCKPY